jgi:hypothetical protein
VTVYYHGTPVLDVSGFGGFYFTGDYAFNLGVGLDADPPPMVECGFPASTISLNEAPTIFPSLLRYENGAVQWSFNFLPG